MGVVELHENVTGLRLAAILGDDMGLGKILTTVITWDLNFRAVAQVYGAKTQPGVDRQDSPLNFPPLVDGRLNGAEPKIGATSIIASPQGIDV